MSVTGEGINFLSNKNGRIDKMESGITITITTDSAVSVKIKPSSEDNFDEFLERLKDDLKEET